MDANESEKLNECATYRRRYISLLRRGLLVSRQQLDTGLFDLDGDLVMEEGLQVLW
jgi:hypothetical protein